MKRRARLSSKLKSELGPVIVEALGDESVSDVCVNDDGKIWIHRYGQSKNQQGHMNPVQSGNLIRTVASMCSVTVNEKNPMIEATLPDGERFTGDVYPISEQPTFCIRRKVDRVYTLESYLDKGMMTKNKHSAIIFAIKNHKNILIVGGTGSGKTALLNAILIAINKYTPEDRILIFEDIRELQCPSSDRSFKMTSEGVDMHSLLRLSMRQMPDRIVVGEVRGAEAEVVQKAWNTGHQGGMVTLHANSAAEGAEKFFRFVQEGSPGTITKNATATAIDFIVYMPKRKNGAPPRVEEVVELDRIKGDEFHFKNSEYINYEIENEDDTAAGVGKCTVPSSE